MDHDADLPLGQPERLGRGRVEDRVHRLDLQEMIPRAETADLVQPAVGGAAADLRRVGAVGHAVILAPVQVTLAAVALRDSIADPAGQQFLQLRPAVQVPYAAAPGAARDHRGELVHHLAQDWGQLVPAQVGGEQSDAARDVETHPARRHNTTAGDVGRGDPADREPVTPVHIRHRIRRRHDARQFRDIAHLLQRTVRGRVRDQRPRREHHARHPHPPVPRDDKPVRRFRDDLHGRSTSSHEGSTGPSLRYGVRRFPLAGSRMCSATVPVEG